MRYLYTGVISLLHWRSKGLEGISNLGRGKNHTPQAKLVKVVEDIQSSVCKILVTLTQALLDLFLIILDFSPIARDV